MARIGNGDVSESKSISLLASWFSETILHFANSVLLILLFFLRLQSLWQVVLSIAFKKSATCGSFGEADDNLYI